MPRGTAHSDQAKASAATPADTSEVLRPKRSAPSRVQPHPDARHREHAARHGEQDPGAERDQPGEEHRLVEHRDVVAHHRPAGAGERRGRHQRRAGEREREPRPSQRQGARAAVQAPQRAGKGEKPHQHRQVDVRHQRDVEEIDQREHVLDPRRARGDQQERQHPRGGERDQREQQPARGERTARVRGQWQGIGIHDSTIPPRCGSKSMLRTRPAPSATPCSRSAPPTVTRSRWRPAGTARRR